LSRVRRAKNPMFTGLVTVSDRFSPFLRREKTAPGLSGFPVFWEEGSQLALLHGGQPTEHVGEVLGGIDAAALAAHDD
jgi:hypothetical protein